jgi:hypothetical protein
MPTFALFGAAGYIAPRHLRAIRDTGNDLLFVVDPSDSVGVLDQYFPDAEYYKTADRRPLTTDGRPRSAVRSLRSTMFPSAPPTTSTRSISAGPWSTAPM